MDDAQLFETLTNPGRLRVLHGLDLLTSPARPAFDRHTRRVAQLLHVPVSLISLVEADRQLFLSSTGLPEPWHSAGGTPLSHSFCQYVVAGRAPLVIGDARRDRRVASNLAIPDLGVIAYVGVPLVGPEGAVLGALCAIDHAPRAWLSDEVTLLEELADGVMTEVALAQAQRAERRAAAQQRQAEARLAAMASHVPDAIWSVDRSYHVTASNQAGAALLMQITGGLPFIPCAPGCYAGWRARYDRALGGETLTVEESVLVDGAPSWFELAFSPIRVDGALDGVVVVGRNITSRRAEAERLRHLADENARLYTAEQAFRLDAERAERRAAQRSALTAALAGALSPHEVAEISVSQGASALGAYAGAFVLRRSAEDDLKPIAAIGYPPALIEAWPTVPIDSATPVAAAVRTQQPIWLPDREAITAQFPALFEALGPSTQAQAAIPLVAGGEALAVIGLSFDSPQTFGADDRAFILTIAQQCAQALDRARLFESLQRELAERQRAEATLRLHDRAIAASRNGILITDARQPDNPIIYCNPAFTALTGYAAEEVIGRNCRFLQGPDTDPAAVAAVRAALEAGESCQITLRNYHKDGSPFWNDLSIAPVWDEHGQITHFVGVQADVTARVDTLEALQASEERFARAFAASPVALSIATLAEGRVLEANAGFVELSGHRREELIGQSVFDLALWASPRDRERLVRALDTWPTVRDVEIRFRTRGGSVRTGLVAATTVELHGERCLLTQVQDISAWKAAETALRASEARFRSLAQSAPDCIYVVNLTTRDLVYCNRDDLLGYPMEMLRQPGALFAAVHDDDRAEVLAHWAELASTPEDRPHVIEYRMRRADGAWEWLQNRGTVLDRDETGQATQLMVSVSVITERKQAEEERRALDRTMLETQKLESLGVLAGGIAHDFNNMLVAVLGNAELALLDLPQEHPAETSVAQIQVAARRAAELTGQLLAYSGRGRFVVGPLDLGALVGEMAALLRASIPRTVTLDYALSPGLPLVEGDATQLRQVVMNLVINAAEAIGDGDGAVRVRVQPRSIDPAYLSTCVCGASAPPGPYLALEVSDTGVGMDAATVRRIFEPFFTTKFAGRGLGMAAVQGIVRAHGGAIQITSVERRGTTITILLPLAAPQPSAPPAAVESATPVTAAETQQLILVIDDEPDVRRVTGRMLERVGYGVVSAADGEAGLAALDSTPEIAAVLLDLTMPGLTGEETFQRLRRRRPGLPVVVVSGYSAQEVRSRLSAEGTVHVLQKPFTPGALRETLAHVLPGRR